MIKTLFFLLILPIATFCQTRGTSVTNYDFSGNPAATVSLPAWNVAGGGTIVGCVRFAGTSTVRVGDTGSANTFTVTNYSNEQGNTRVAMFKAENTKAVSGDVLTFTFSPAGGSYTAEAAVQYSGTAASAYDVGAVGTGTTGTTAVSTPFTTTQGPEIAVACGSYADTSVVPGYVGTTPFTIAAADGPNRIITIEDANLYQVQTNVTATLSDAISQQWGFVAGTFKSAQSLSPPAVTQSFSNGAGSVAGVTWIYAGSSATVSFKLTNVNTSASLSGIVLTDTLPTGMSVASPNGLAVNCPGATVDATPGSNAVSLFGASLAAGASCTLSLTVTSDTPGTAVNTTGNVTSTQSPSGGKASATLVVYGTPAITISDIAVNSVGHAQANFSYLTSAAGHCQLQYGLSSGNYIYSGGSAPTYNNGNNGCQMTLGGLAPNTTYYVMPTARPDANDITGMCQGGGSCGATEQVFTTLPLPAQHPAPPAPPNSWTPEEPNTSNYTVVSMQASATDGTCVAAANVAKQANWSAAVNAGDSLQTVVDKIWFDTAIEFAEGSSCNVPSNDPYFHTGVVLPQYSPAGGPNDWVVVRTHANSASDLPPFGVRTGPQFASKLANLVAQTPGNPISPANGEQNFNGELFDCFEIGCNHFWFENLGMTHAFNATLYPAGIVDPPAFVDYVRFVPKCSLSTYGCVIDAPASTPSHIVLDRIYAFGQPWPSREMGCFVPGGNYWAIINSYCVTNFWAEPSYPQVNPTSSGGTISIPASTFQFNAFDNNPIGMTAPATAVFTGSGVSTYSGNVFAWIGTGGLTVEYQSAPNVTMTCTGCTAIASASPAQTDVPYNRMFYFWGAFNGAGSFNLIYTTPWNGTATIFSEYRPLGIYLYPGQYGVFDNNYLQAIGQTIYNDAYGQFEDILWTHNYFYFPRSKMQNSGQWDGYAYTFRNVIETKGMTRAVYAGNIIDGSASNKNPGNAIYIAGSYGGSTAGSYGTGAQDIQISNNIFKHLSSGFQTAGGGAQQPPDSPPATRYAVTNNLWLDLNRDIYNNGGGGLASGAFTTYPMMSDLNFSNNTIGLTKGSGPSLLYFGGASATGTSVLGEGLLYSNNVAITSLGGADVIISIDGGQDNSYTNFPANPVVMASLTAPVPGTWQQYLDSDFVQTGASIARSWVLANNVVIGGQNNRGLMTGSWVDLTPAQISSSIQAFWPAADTTTRFPCSLSDSVCRGSSMAARLQAVGWNPAMDLTSGNPSAYAIQPTRYNAGNLGANVTEIVQAAGIVGNVSVNPGQNAIQFAYTAPDTRSCSADISPDGSTWTRLTDAGGVLARSLTFTGLTAGTGYQYRLMCYFDQSAAYEFLPSQITSGTVATTTGAARTVAVTFQLPPNASKAVFQFVPVNGAAVSQTCSASPCSVSLATGKWTRTLTFETRGSAVVGSPSSTSITVQ